MSVAKRSFRTLAVAALLWLSGFSRMIFLVLLPWPLQ